MKKSEDYNRMKDDLEEYRHLTDKLQKSEALIEKYKKKLEDSCKNLIY
jgi:protein HOOK3